MDTIKLTLNQLELLLNQQKEIVIEKLSQNTHMFNTESTEGYTKALPIDKEKFRTEGLKSNYPPDFNTLKKYI